MSQATANGSGDSPAEATIESVESAGGARRASGWIRGFRALIALQFQSALSLYLLLHAAVVFLLHREGSGLERSGNQYALLGLVLAVPQLLFSGYAGIFANRLSKRFVLLLAKMVEAGTYLAAFLLMYFLGRGPASTFDAFVLTGALFLVSMQGAFYTPSKYGIVAEIVPEDRLSWANGMLEMAGFMSVLFGLFAAQALHTTFEARQAATEDVAAIVGTDMHWIALVLFFLSLMGLGFGYLLPKVDAATTKGKIKERLKPNVFLEVWRSLRIILADRVVALTALGVAAFWSFVTVAMANASRWAREDLGFPVPELGGWEFFSSPLMLTAMVGVGVGLGSVMVAILTKKGPELGFVPLGGLGVSIFALPLGLASPGVGPTPDQLALSPMLALSILTACLVLLGVCGGFFLVPLLAMVQSRVQTPVRGGVMAAVNFLCVAGMVVCTATYWVLLKGFDFSAAQLYTIFSMFAFFGTAFFVILLPEAMLGLVRTVVTRFIYRIRRPVLGADNIPATGPALLLSNHVSMVDALLILAISPRPVRFIVWKEIFDNPVLGYFLKIMNAIPVAGDARPRALIASLSQASEALNNGEVVCVFSDGEISKAGLLLPGRRGFKHILEKAPAPIVPIYLEGVSAGIFGFERKRYRWKLPTRLRYDVQVAIGAPMDPESTLHDIRQAVVGLSADCAVAKRSRMAPVHHRFVRHARRNFGDFCVADSTSDYEPEEPRKKRSAKERLKGLFSKGPKKERKTKPANPPRSFGMTLVGSIIVARRLRKHWRDQDMVGIFLPPSVPGVVTNVAAALAGRTAVNLNYTIGPEVLRHCIRTCGIRTIVTSKLFVTRIGMKDLENCIYLEDLLKAKPPTLVEKLSALLAARLLPIRMLESFCGCQKHPTADSLLTVIFSSGSTGMPKGVMLTHGNIASNIESFEKGVALWTDDRMMGFLPLFHSFGYTVALWGSLDVGFGVIHHNNPLEAKVIGDLVEKYKITLMIATPTFLQQYTRRIEPEKLQTLEFVLTGAEKLQLRVAEAFEERFGIYVFEGYGTSECAPVVSANLDEYRSRRPYHTTNKRGTVGRPCPGIAVRITDVDTGAVLPGNQVGMIEVRGANIMQGYLNEPEKTAAAIRDGGWYVTGDLGLIDDDGFIRITDRLARFSKIGGEMVPHVRIEEDLHAAYGFTEQTFAVTAIPDENKGERLIVLHTTDPESLKDVNDKLGAAGLPNLWMPRRNSYFKIEAIPVLGTGKLDLARIRQLAKELAAGGEKGGGDGE